MRNDKKPADMSATDIDKYAKATNNSNLKQELNVHEVELQLLKKDFYFKDPVTHYRNRTIYAFLPSQPVPEGLEAINTKDMESFEKASLYASYICDQKDFRYKESTVNPALLMFVLTENGEDNLIKLKSHLYHKAMLVHVGKEIYLLREDQEKLVSMIFPGKKITSVLMITKDKNGNFIREVNNEYYNFTKDDVNKTLEYFGNQLKTTSERQEPYYAAGAALTSSVGDINNDGKNKGEEVAGSNVVREHPHNTRSKAEASAGKRKRDAEEIPEELLGDHTKKLAAEKNRVPSKAI